jgi:hypothetical protein
MFLSIDEKSALHTANDLNWKSLSQSRKETLKYIREAKKAIFGGTLEWPDHEDRYEIVEALGPPPAQVTPIYFMTIDNGKREEIVYIGKTTTENRFQNGHHAALQLHDPKYKGEEKYIYRCSVWFYTEDQYFSCEWIPDLKFSEAIIDSVESHLIFGAKPELNTQKVVLPRSKWALELVPDTVISHRITNLPRF